VDGGVEPEVLGVASLVGVLVDGGASSEIGVLSEVCDLYGVREWLLLIDLDQRPVPR